MRPTATVVALATAAVVASGGATGTTLALWRQQAVSPAGSVTAGTIGLDVSGTGTAGLSDLEGLEPGVRRAQRIAFRNTGTGRHLRLDVRLVGVSGPDASGVPLLLEYRPRRSPADDCSGGSYLPLDPGSVVAAGLEPADTADGCLGVTLQLAEMPTSVLTSTLTLTFEGRQVLS